MSEPKQDMGLCDSKCGRPATSWYGQTNSATCGSKACLAIINKRYAEHCEEMDRKAAFDKEMKEIYGDPDNY